MSAPLSFLASLVFPPRCVGCNRRLPPVMWKRAPFLCADCAERWRGELSMQCPKCAAAYAACRCQPDVMRRAGCHGFIKLVPYGREECSVAPHVIREMKRSPRRRLFSFAAGELCEDVRRYLAESGIPAERCVISFLPRSPQSKRRTGVDQAACLARALSREAGIPYQPLLKRKGGKRVQKSLSARARMQNLRDAFAVVGALRGACVLLVDDIVTTGAGMSAATALLRKAGASEVIAVSLAHTERKKQNA